ncbi:hypothetical protein JOF41_006352 [Saccharothrix coeruleofusca]|uniref:hypothetical protein n=1 Tax=Saccharothrix coeruleofusca TaxID=33919 RepID=UPI001AE1EC4F|nr:hypothetical protein [Saccharothrix coeruleofusca]MBP2340174.1 hypothetical protein [Saccharothrix coeruleofusca]
MPLTVAEQQAETLATFSRVERIEAVAATLDDNAAAKLRDIVEEMIDSTPPVRITAAAKLLNLSKPTIHAWCERGVLKRADGSPVRTLDPHRLHAVLHIVRDLRVLADQPGNLLEQVWHRLQDRTLLETEELREGLASWRAGDVVEA